MSKKNKLIPELRFPEFKNQGEWEYVYGDELFESISNKDHNSDLSILAITQEQGAVPRDMINYHVSVTDKSIESYKVVEIGDFIISLRSFQGGIEYSNYLGLCSPAYIVLRKKEDVINDFYRHYFKSYPFIQDLNKNLEGIRDGKMISYTQFSEILIPKPKIKEQKKIASCLSSLDEVISAYNERLEILKDHKKGLMQNLFPQEGEKMPKYRFPEFKKDGNWEVKSFEQLFTIGNGRDYKHLDSGDIPVYGSGGYMLSVNDYLYDGESVCIGRKGTIDKPMFLSGKFWTVDTLFYTHSFKKCLPMYIFYVFENIDWRNHNEAGGVPSLSKTNIYKIEILVPPTIQEQKKIASCLTALDKLINAQTEKIEQLKLHKKGLMQGLFPKAIN